MNHWESWLVGPKSLVHAEIIISVISPVVNNSRYEAALMRYYIIWMLDSVFGFKLANLVLVYTQLIIFIPVIYSYLKNAIVFSFFVENTSFLFIKMVVFWLYVF